MTKKGLTLLTVVAAALRKAPKSTQETESKRKISTEIRLLKIAMEFLSMMKTRKATLKHVKECLTVKVSTYFF